MESLVRLEEVRVHFALRKMLFRTATVAAVEDVSLDIRPGETLAIVGESGSGKTTLGRAALRLLPVTGGRVLFDGHDITHTPDSRLKWFRRRAQAVFQDPYSSIDPFMSVFQVLEEPMVIHGVGDRRDRIESALRDVRLTPPEEYLPKYPHMLSGGQRQRVGIARALMLRPQFIVADEPVSMIDASSRAEILLLLRDLQQQYGMAFLYVTHDIATVRYFAHRLAVMYLGVVVEVGTPGAIIDNPLHPYTQALIAAVPAPDPSNRLREREVVPGEPPSPANAPSGCRFHPRCPHAMPGLCDVVTPPLLDEQKEHSVACHLYTPEGRSWTAPGRTRQVPTPNRGA